MSKLSWPRRGLGRRQQGFGSECSRSGGLGVSMEWSGARMRGRKRSE